MIGRFGGSAPKPRCGSWYMKYNLYAKIIILLVSTIISLFIILEIVLRCYSIVNSAFVLMPDDTYLRYRGKPHSREFNGFRLNSMGYKDEEFNTIKKPGVFRIIGIGDSYTYGAVPYQNCYITLLKKKILLVDKDCEVLNLGIPAAGPVDYLSLFVNEGLSLHPDMVLVNIFTGDDFKDGGKRFKLYSYSAAATCINSMFANWRAPEGRIFGSGVYQDDVPLQSEASYLQYLADVESGTFQKSNAYVKDDVLSSLFFLKEIKRLCDLKNIAFAVVLCPSELQWHPALQKKLTQKLHITIDDFDFRLPNRILAHEFNRLEIEYLDLLDFFLDSFKNNMKSFNKPNDPHWNLYGNRFAADLVNPWLLKQINRKKNRV